MALLFSATPRHFPLIVISSLILLSVFYLRHDPFNTHQDANVEVPVAKVVSQLPEIASSSEVQYVPSTSVRAQPLPTAPSQRPSPPAPVDPTKEAVAEQGSESTSKPEPKPESKSESDHESEPTPPPTTTQIPQPIYKSISTRPPPPPIKESFPLAAAAGSPFDLPPIPPWNKPPRKHVPEKTPLFIGFTRNWPLLQQAVVGYITAGWPPDDIYVVENTGTMDSNKKRRLSIQNPFYLDHDRLTNIYGVNVIVTPTLFTFAQMQSLYLSLSIENNWPYYFWSHMDVLPQSLEDQSPYKSLYMRCVDAIRTVTAPGGARDGEGREGRWALVFFSYDWLTLMNTETMVELGGWDTMISYYSTDCDMYERMRMANLSTLNAPVQAGIWYDMGEPLDDLEILYRRKPNASPAPNSKPARRGFFSSNLPPADTRNSSTFHALQALLEQKQLDKNSGRLIRNAWQTHQYWGGGKGEPFYRDQDGFEQALEVTIKAGQKVYQRKWGVNQCDLRKYGLELGDAWRVQKGFEGPYAEGYRGE